MNLYIAFCDCFHLSVIPGMTISVYLKPCRAQGSFESIQQHSTGDGSHHNIADGGMVFLTVKRTLCLNKV